MLENKQEFARRRQILLAAIGPGNMGMILAASEVFRNADTHYPYRQDSDFYYLTGLREPEAMALFIPGRAEGEFVLLLRERDPAQEMWTGQRMGCEGAKTIYGADQAFSIKQKDEVLANLRAQRVDIRSLIHEQRVIKSPVEIACMRRAADITVLAHRRAMQHCRPGLYEYELEAELQHEFIRQGARFSAYESIVGSGANACTLHYVNNSAPMRGGDLVLIDAGAEFDYYAADVTRTFPVNGRFTPDQKALYEVVLHTQLTVIASIAPGVLWNDLEALAALTITKGLVHLGILHGDAEQLWVDKAYRLVYMHRIGHWLGLDVQDVGSYKVAEKSRPLLPGMVLTVEPGIYIPLESLGIDQRWWGMGIRIEDDVLVTEIGHDVLTAGLAKTVEDIEGAL